MNENLIREALADLGELGQAQSVARRRLEATRARFMKQTAERLWRRYVAHQRFAESKMTFRAWLLSKEHFENTFSNFYWHKTRRNWAIAWFKFIDDRRLAVGDEGWHFEQLAAYANARQHGDNAPLIRVVMADLPATHDGVKQGVTYAFEIMTTEDAD